MDTLRVQWETADAAMTLQRLRDAGIGVLDVVTDDAFCLHFCIAAEDEHTLLKLSQAVGEPCHILQRRGIRVVLFSLLRRCVLVMGFALLLLLSAWIPGRILFIQVEGNENASTGDILNTAAHNGIYFGAAVGDVRSQTLKNALLSDLPCLQWAGISIEGCVAVIHVRERSDPPQAQPQPMVGSIVAARDGIIRQIVVQNGVAACKPGDAVRAGQMLISGYLDCGICIRACCAEGEVYALTNRQITVLTPIHWQQRRQKTRIAKKYSLIIGKKRINFANSSGNLEPTCAKIYSGKYVTLPGGFILPLGIVTETYYTSETTPFRLEPGEDAQKAFAHAQLLSQLNAGQILSGDCQICTEADVCRFVGTYECLEMIGILRPEESLPNYEND